MRLDHLLSKEHLALFGVSRRQIETTVLAGLLMGGTYDMALIGAFSASTSLRWLERGEGVGGGLHAVGS